VQRVEQDHRIVYIERRRLASVIFFVLAVLLLALTPLLPETKHRRHGRHTDEENPRAIATVFAVGCVVISIFFLFQNRAFIIEQGRGALVILDRQLLSRERRREHALQGLTVRPTSVAYGEHYIWIELPNGRSILFQGGIRDPEYLRRTVAQLIEDLRPT